jgi:hypothetical protein
MSVARRPDRWGRADERRWDFVRPHELLFTARPRRAVGGLFEEGLVRGPRPKDGECGHRLLLFH